VTPLWRNQQTSTNRCRLGNYSLGRPTKALTPTHSMTWLGNVLGTTKHIIVQALYMTHGDIDLWLG